MNGVIKFDWAGTKLATITPSKRFTKFVHVPKPGCYLAFTPGKSIFYVLKEDFTVIVDMVSLVPVDRMIYGGRNIEDNAFEFFICSGTSLNVSEDPYL